MQDMARKFYVAGGMLGSRCGSLAVGASPVDAYTHGGHGRSPLMLAIRADRAPTSPPEENFRINMRPFMPQADRSPTETMAAEGRRMQH